MPRCTIYKSLAPRTWFTVHIYLDGPVLLPQSIQAIELISTIVMTGRPTRCDNGGVEVGVEIPEYRAESFGCLRPFDSLKGRVVLSSKRPLSFSRVEVHLEGKARNFVYHPHWRCFPRIVLIVITGMQSIVAFSRNMTQHVASRRVSLPLSSTSRHI